MYILILIFYKYLNLSWVFIDKLIFLNRFFIFIHYYIFSHALSCSFRLFFSPSIAVLPLPTLLFFLLSLFQRVQWTWFSSDGPALGISSVAISTIASGSCCCLFCCLRSAFRALNSRPCSAEVFMRFIQPMISSF